MIAVPNGYTTQDTSRNEGKQEEKQECLQCEARPFSRSPKRKDRYIYIENSTVKVKPFLIKEVATVEELLEELFLVIPQLNNPVLGLHITNARAGAIHREFFEDELPEDAFFLYITLYLKKHPPISLNKN